MASVAPEGEKYAADAPAEQKMLRGPQPDGGPLPDQPSLMDCGDGASVCGHKGTKAYPANPGMLDAGAVSGTYDCPAAPCTSVYVGAVPAVGFLCMCPKCGPVPVCCAIAPFNCCGGLGYGGTPIDFLYLPTGKCLPKSDSEIQSAVGKARNAIQSNALQLKARQQAEDKVCVFC